MSLQELKSEAYLELCQTFKGGALQLRTKTFIKKLFSFK